MISQLPTISTAAQQIRAGQLEPTELVEFCLAQIRRYDEQIHAWVLVDADGARREALRLGDMACRGEFLGPLHGIPMGIKDIIDVAGMPTKAGSPLRENHRAEHDAPVVAALRQAGAIILGKTVTTEFACFDPPPTRNPWNLSHTPGGSSSGSAAGVAMQMCMATLGSQTGGSITRPASYCGVAGLKPTRGAVSTDGVVPISFHLDHVGPIARSAADLRCVWQAMTGSSLANESASCEDNDQPPLQRLGLLEPYFREQANADVWAATEAALDRLRQAGVRIVPIPLPASFAEVRVMHRRIMAVEAAEYHRESFAAHRDSYGPHIAALIEEGLATLSVDYAAALKHRLQFQRDMAALLDKCQILLTPATNTTAPRIDSTGDPRFNSPWSHAGLPTVNIPCGLATNNMPCGLQLIGPPHSESYLLSAGSWCEQRLEFDGTPPFRLN
jgi:Asp-tRNA(Asn)/Glu-tRNA(Gln) amidotransferase A subunit family amidase